MYFQIAKWYSSLVMNSEVKVSVTENYIKYMQKIIITEICFPLTETLTFQYGIKTCLLPW